MNDAVNQKAISLNTVHNARPQRCLCDGIGQWGTSHMQSTPQCSPWISLSNVWNLSAQWNNVKSIHPIRMWENMGLFHPIHTTFAGSTAAAQTTRRCSAASNSTGSASSCPFGKARWTSCPRDCDCPPADGTSRGHNFGTERYPLMAHTCRQCSIRACPSVLSRSGHGILPYHVVHDDMVGPVGPVRNTEHHT